MGYAAKRQQRMVDQYQAECLAARTEVDRIRGALEVAPESEHRALEKALRRAERANKRATENLDIWTKGIGASMREAGGQVVEAAKAFHAQVMFGGLVLEGSALSYRGESQNVTNARVVVETAGEIDRRASLTRVAAGGVLFGGVGAIVGGLAQKKIDRRELYLLVEGEHYSWAVPVNPSNGPAARAFAAKVNTVARSATA